MLYLIVTNNKKKPLEQSPSTSLIRQSKRRIIIGISIIIFLIILNLLTGILSYSFMIIKCGGYPITASRFAASYHYYTPNSPYYGPNIFAEYYCTSQEAEAAGFNSF